MFSRNSLKLHCSTLSKLGIARLPIHHLRSIQATLCCYGIACCILLSRMYKAGADFTSRKSTFICLEKAFYLTEPTTQWLHGTCMYIAGFLTKNAKINWIFKKCSKASHDSTSEQGLKHLIVLVKQKSTFSVSYLLKSPV